MIYSNIEYKVKFYERSDDGKSPVLEYFDKLSKKREGEGFEIY